jgi:hypothetical protein
LWGGLQAGTVRCTAAWVVGILGQHAVWRHVGILGTLFSASILASLVIHAHTTEIASIIPGLSLGVHLTLVDAESLVGQWVAVWVGATDAAWWDLGWEGGW